ncbi:MAG: hypothetical protein HQK53_17445 [Oligoflexia bacterium]|nr:hypothetical protein [Oligoflexia bacterium]
MKTAFQSKLGPSLLTLTLTLFFFPLIGQSANFDDRDFLSAVANTEPNRPLKIDPSVKADQVFNAFKALHGKLKVNENNHAKLEVDPDFSRSLGPEHRKGLDKLAKGFEQRINEGSIKVVRGSSGKLEVRPGNGKNEGMGIGHRGLAINEDASVDLDEVSSDFYRAYHSVSNGWWSWSTSYSWWGVKVSLNHNFLWYLCKYTTWMLGASSLPSWIEYVLKLIACLPHNCDSGANGSAVYVTWAGAFWYNC